MIPRRLLATISLAIAVLVPSVTLLAQEPPAPVLVDSSQAQAEAVKRFPELGQEGSLFRQAFLERTAKYRRESPAALEQPGWPLKLAEEVAAALTTHADEALKVTREPDPARGKEAKDSAFLIQIANLGTTRAVDAQLKVTYAEGEPVMDKRHFDPSSTQTFSYATTQKNVTKVEIVSASFAGKPMPVAVKAPPKPQDNHGIPVPGKPGFVTSPFAPDAGYIDVRGFPAGTQVKDPYSGQMFLVP